MKINFNKVSKWYILACVLSASMLAYGLTKLTQVALVNSTIDSTPIGQTTPAAGTFNSVHVVSGTTLSSQGYYVGWNRNILGETDFHNSNGGGPGGYYWFNTNLDTQLMSLNSLGVLTANGFTGPLQGNVVGTLNGNVVGSISGGNVSGTTGAFGNLIAACTGCGELPWNPGSFSGGTWLGWNQNGGNNGESDLINRFPSGYAGGFSWFSTTGSSLVGQIMNLTPGGLLTVNQLNGNTQGTHTGSNVGNSSTSSAFDHTPGSCANYSGMYGISATGAPTCAPTVYGRTTSVNFTAAAGGSTTSTSVPLSAIMPDTNYAVSCAMVNQTGFPFIYGYSKTTTSVTVSYSNGFSNQAVVSGASEIDCTISGT